MIPEIHFETAVAIGRKYAAAIASLPAEIARAIADCPACGVPIGEYCTNGRGRQSPGSLHADRRTAVNQWSRTHREEYASLRERLIRTAFARMLGEPESWDDGTAGDIPLE